MIRKLFAILCVTYLAACTTDPASDTTSSAAASSTSATGKASINIDASSDKQPFNLLFEGKKTKLNHDMTVRLDDLVRQLQFANKIHVRGYCNKADVRNCSSVARARALAVKKYLVKKGVKPAKITFDVDIKEPLHAVAVEVGD